MRAVSATHSAASDCDSAEVGLAVADADLDGREREVRPHAPPQLRVLGDRARVVEEADVLLVVGPRVERVGDATARKEAGEDLRPGRVQARVDALGERRARRQREQLRQPVAERRRHLERPVGAANPDVDVEAEGVVLPDDVAEQLVVAPVVRRVDDPLVLPVRPGMRTRRAERETERLDERYELVAALGDRLRHGGEALHLAGLDLDLGRDQLSGEEPLDLRSRSRRLDVLEAVDEVERDRVEQGELLLHGHGEVGALVEPLPGVTEELVCRNALLVAHAA